MSTTCLPTNRSDDDGFYVINEVCTKRLGCIPILNGNFEHLPRKAQKFVAEKAELMSPRGIYICDGLKHEANEIIHKLVERGVLTELKAYENNYLCRTDPEDVANFDDKTWVVTPDKYDTMCHIPEGLQAIIGNWMSPQVCANEMDSRFPGCMAGRTMFVIPFSMGPIGGALSKIGVQLTDSNYAVLCMRILTRVSSEVWDALGDNDFVQCIHSIGLPRPVKNKVINHWPCNPERVFIAHIPANREIWSFGSGYGGSSLLGKKCFALRIASNIAHSEGWLAEHMLIIGVTPPNGKERFIAAAFPFSSGKTAFATLQTSLPGWKVKIVGDDVAWMKFDENGVLHGINPEAGFFRTVSGISMKTNPVIMSSLQKNCIFTNVAETADGRYFWEGLEEEIVDKHLDIKDWQGNLWHIGDKTLAAHPRSRFNCPMNQCPMVHPDWESAKGVPIEAIVFGSRRSNGVPLVFETFSWAHGVFTGASLKSEQIENGEQNTTKSIVHDPMAMRTFMGYNFGKYLQHWINMEKSNRKMPKIFHVNWFRKDKTGQYLWPGFGENILVLDWIIRRLDGDQSIGTVTPIGTVPVPDSIKVQGRDKIDMKELLSVPTDYWCDDMKENRKFFEEQVGSDLPKEIRNELEALAKRLVNSKSK